MRSKLTDLYDSSFHLLRKSSRAQMKNCVWTLNDVPPRLISAPSLSISHFFHLQLSHLQLLKNWRTENCNGRPSSECACRKMCLKCNLHKRHLRSSPLWRTFWVLMLYPMSHSSFKTFILWNAKSIEFSLVNLSIRLMKQIINRFCLWELTQQLRRYVTKIWVFS